ncbi:MAG: hypothetical protein QM764_15345 [Chitinophagaceae bacterium]
MEVIIIAILFIGFSGVVVLVDFLAFLSTGKQIVNQILFRASELTSLIILPMIYANFGAKNDCCDEDSAVFSPDHQLTIAIVIVLCLIAYFYSSYRTRIATPIVELIINAFLFIGIILNCFIAFHTKDFGMAVGGNVPIILLAILVLTKNHRLFIAYSQEQKFNPSRKIESIAWKILNLRPVLKYPVIFILCLPILTILSLLLLLVGQKPDSLIRAFTDTYKHGFSQWDYKCDNVECGGHYLCSVAANGHKIIVKPNRFGVRNGGRIICNRQLLIANAFEELIQEKTPFLHKLIRKQYNKVGDLVHRYYGIFNIKLVSDCVYIIMKPAELIFLFVLYTFDRNPENRIAKQYLDQHSKHQIEQFEHLKTN